MATKGLRMTPLFFHLLLTLSAGPRHGYAMMSAIEERTGGRLDVGPSSLYYALGRLEDAGLIVEPDTPHEDRRRYFRLSEAGRERLEEEMELLDDIVRHARAQGVLR
jgi:DNA-binding PadR family transcriptional regulator